MEPGTERPGRDPTARQRAGGKVDRMEQRDESKATARPWSVDRFRDKVIAYGSACENEDAEDAPLLREIREHYAALLACREALRVALDDMTLLMTGRCPRDLVDEIHARFVVSAAVLAASQPKAGAA